MPRFWSQLSVEVIRHYTPQEQLAEWKARPGTERIDASDVLPHGGICHLFLLKIK